MSSQEQMVWFVIMSFVSRPDAVQVVSGLFAYLGGWLRG